MDTLHHAERTGAARQNLADALIATAAIDSFSQWIAQHQLEGITLISSGQAALQWVRGCASTGVPQNVFLDFRPLADGWSGLRLARALRRLVGERPRIRLMADSCDSQLHELVIQAGGDGLVRRSPRAVMRSMGVATAELPVTPQDRLEHVQPTPTRRHRVLASFRTLAGPLASLHIAEVVQAQGGADADEAQLVEQLARRLVLPTARRQFLSSVADVTWLP